MKDLAIETIGLIPGWSWLLVFLVGLYYSFPREDSEKSFLIFFLGMLVPYIDNFAGFILSGYSSMSGFFHALIGVLVACVAAIFIFRSRWWILIVGYFVVLVFDGDTSVNIYEVLIFFIGAFVASYVSYKGRNEVYDYASAHEADKYNKKRFSSEAGKKVDSFERAIICDFIGGKKLHSVVDMGAGTGRVSTHLLECAEVYKLVLLDSSMQMLRVAKENLRGRDEKLEFVEQDVLDSGFSGGSFDVAAAFHLVKHVSDLEGLVREMARITRKNGYVLLEVTNSRSVSLLWRNKARLRSYEQVCRVADNNELVVEKVSGCNFLGESVYWMIPSGFLDYFYKFDRFVSGFLTLYCSKIIFLMKKT